MVQNPDAHDPFLEFSLLVIDKSLADCLKVFDDSKRANRLSQKPHQLMSEPLLPQLSRNSKRNGSRCDRGEGQGICTHSKTLVRTRATFGSILS